MSFQDTVRPIFFYLYLRNITVKLAWPDTALWSFPWKNTFLKFLNINIHFLLIFYLNPFIFSSNWCKIVQILECLFGFTYFVKYLRGYLQKKFEGGFDKYEIKCEENSGRAEKKVQNFKIAFLSDQPFMKQISF